MKFEEILKNMGIAEEQISKIMAAMKENKIYLTSEENIDVRYQKLKEQKEEADKQLKTANETIEALKKDNKSNEELQKKVQEYENNLEALKKQSEQKDFDNAVEMELMKIGVHSVKAAKAELNLENVKRNSDGSFSGLSEQLEKIKTEKAWLLKTGEKKPQYTPQGGETKSSDLTVQMKSKDFNFTEFLKQQAENEN